MKVSVIIPSYNGKVLLQKVLAALTSYPDQPDEIVLVDDGSEEDLEELSEYFSIRYHRLFANLGAGYARNFGATKAIGDILVFIDSDVVPDPNYLQIIREEIENGSDGVGGRYCLPAELKTPFNRFIQYQEEIYWGGFGERAEVSIFYGGLCAFKRSAWFSKDRTYHEVQQFKHKASGEDCLVCHEIKQSHKLIYRRDLAGLHYSDLEKNLFSRGANQAETRARNILLNGKKALQDNVVQQFEIGFLFLGYCFLILAILAPYSLFWVTLALGLFFYGYRRFKIIQFHEFPLLLRFMVIQQSSWIYGLARWVFHSLTNEIYATVSWGRTTLAYLFRNSPNKLFFFVTNRCNSDCGWCLDKTRGTENQPANKSTELSIDEIRQITLNYRQSLPYLTITGGEPFLRLDVDQIVSMFYKNNSTRFVTIVTNGSYPERIKEQVERILILCPFLKINVQLTVSELPEQHDLIRGLKNSSDLIEQSANKLHSLKKVFPSLMFSVATQIEDTKMERLPLIVDHVYEKLNPDEHFLALLRDVPLLISKVNTSLERMVELSRVLTRKYKKRLSLFQSFYNRAILSSVKEINMIREGKGQYRPCKAGQKFLTLYENGNLLACENRQDLIAANLRNESYQLGSKNVVEGLKRIHGQQLKEKCHCDWGCAVTDNLMAEPQFLVKNLILAFADYLRQSISRKGF